jgi:AAA15 family ATPase/GTPase
MSFQGISLKAQNVKCFGEEGFGYEEIKPFNIAIGRNNSGKSTLLDLVAYAVEVELRLMVVISSSRLIQMS